MTRIVSYFAARGGVSAMIACVWLLVVMLGYFDLRVNSPELYGGEHANFAAANKGMDFKAVYNYGMALRGGMEEYLAVSGRWPHNVYPPFVTVALLPLTVLPIEMAYHVYAFFLVVFLFLICRTCLAMDEEKPPWGSALAALVVTAILFHSYPVSFSVERGNSDITAALFAVLFLYCIARGRVTLGVLCLTAAIQFKLYPAILVVFLLLRHGWRPVALLSLINVALLFMLGLSGGTAFIELLRAFSNRPFDWPGNHSLHSFVNHCVKAGLLDPSLEGGIGTAILGTLLLLFLAAVVRLFLTGYRGGLAGRNRLSGAEVGLVGMAFAIMGLLPIISHDYKLVIQAVPLLLLMTRSSETLFASPGEAYAMAALASVATALMFIPSYVPLPLAWLGSDYGELLRVKTPWLLTAFIAYAHLAFRGVAAAATAILPTEERPV